MTEAPLDWLQALRRYLAASVLLHLGWEMLQLPLYTIWSQPTGKQAFAVLHCTIGDAMIAGLSLLIALALFGQPAWPRDGARPVWIAVVTLGIGYTLYSEWLNVNVRGTWTYSELMPKIPVIGTGIAPLLQWLVVPTIALQMAIGAVPESAEALSLDEPKVPSTRQR